MLRRNFLSLMGLVPTIGAIEFENQTKQPTWPEYPWHLRLSQKHGVKRQRPGWWAIKKGDRLKGQSPQMFVKVLCARPKAVGTGVVSYDPSSEAFKRIQGTPPSRGYLGCYGVEFLCLARCEGRWFRRGLSFFAASGMMRAFSRQLSVGCGQWMSWSSVRREVPDKGYVFYEPQMELLTDERIMEHGLS